MGLIQNAGAAASKGLAVARRYLPAQRDNLPLSFEQWASYFSFNGISYPFMTGGTQGEKQEVPDYSFEGYVQQIYKTNGIVFACMVARMLPFAEARFQFRRRINGRPGELFGTTALDILERPWRNGTTSDLLKRAIQDADLAGNAFCTLRLNRIRRLRPDWTAIILGSTDPAQADMDPNDIEAEVIGYAYWPGGRGRNVDDVDILLPEQVAHWAPIPDPLAKYKGMSWITPVIREVMGDSAATLHKLRFFENAATPSLAVSLDKSIGKDAFDAFLVKMKEQHEGVMNAYRTLYLAGGATVTPIGANLRQIDFKLTQGAGETRIAAAAQIPPIIVGLSEGLEAATYANYGQARRRFADGTLRPMWRDIAGSLASLVTVPKGSELWYDDRDIPLLKEDLKDEAEIFGRDATSVQVFVTAGFKPDAALKAVANHDLSLLKGEHTGLFSVQLQPPGTTFPALGPGTPPANPPAGTGTDTTPAATPPAKKPKAADLTGRERQVLRLVARGASNKEIGGDLDLSERTVEHHVSALLRKLGAGSRVELAVIASGQAPLVG